MQIRNSAGAIATPIEELAILKQYVASKWEGPAVISPPQPGPPGIPFSVCDLERALSRIPVGKAVAHPFAHGLTWRTHATILAPYILISFITGGTNPLHTFHLFGGMDGYYSLRNP